MSATLAGHPHQALSRPQTMSRAGQIFLAVFFILVYEGAVRKWATGAATLPLIAMRDLLALALIVMAWRRGHLRRNRKITAALFAWSLLVFGWGLLQLAGGESSPVIFILGLRFWLLYTWFAIAAAASMNEADYRAFILMAAWMTLIMAPLAVVQHFSPPGSRINTQLDGDEESVFVAVSGVVRTTGTFSFTTGYSMFIALVAPVVFGLLSARKRRTSHKLLAIATFAAFMAGSFVSGSRTTVIASAMMFMVYLVGRLAFSKMKQKPTAAVAVVVALALFGIFTLFFQEAILVTQTRFEEASAVEDFWERIVTILVAEPHVFNSFNWLGAGIGYGSNLANYVRGGAGGAITLAESEGGRLLLEGGLLGIVYVVLKLVVSVIGVAKSLRLSRKTNSPFPVIVWLTAAMAIITWTASGQLTANGMIGIILAFALLLFRFPTLEIFRGRA
ncbi:MAG: O-antigen polysaccharide polymerase Wzy [Variovorax sp.]|nr:O-antigen polysaccharide polymerase Wzy [Variovorax sp.]